MMMLEHLQEIFPFASDMQKGSLFKKDLKVLPCHFFYSAQYRYQSLFPHVKTLIVTLHKEMLNVIHRSFLCALVVTIH